jgi:hypothetical protein
MTPCGLKFKKENARRFATGIPQDFRIDTQAGAHCELAQRYFPGATKQ